MERREVLAILGVGVTALAGCTGRTGSDPPNATTGDTTTGESKTTTTTTPEPTTTTPDDTRHRSMGETATVGDVAVSVANPRVEKAVVGYGMHKKLEMHAGQWVVVDVTAEGTTRDVAEEELRATVGGDPVSVPGGPSEGRAVSTVSGAYAFPYPTGRPETAGIRWPLGEGDVVWDLPGDAREALAAEPAFRVEEYGLPKRDGKYVLAMTVANEGDRDGVFRALVSSRAFTGHYVVEFPVPAGESREHSTRSMVLQTRNNGGGVLTVEYPGKGGPERLAQRVPSPEDDEE